MRVLTLNVQGFRDGVHRAADVIGAIDPDVVMLSEVFHGQAKRLARETGRVALFGTTRLLRRFGNALLLREPPRMKRNLVFRRKRGLAPRGVIVAGADNDVVYACAHLGLSGDERVQHAIELVALLERYAKVILGCDLNEGPEQPAARYLAGSFRDAYAEAGEGAGETFPVSAPRHRIDYVFCSPSLIPVRAAVVPIAVSDHFAVVAEIVIPQAAPSASAS